MCQIPKLYSVDTRLSVPIKQRALIVQPNTYPNGSVNITGLGYLSDQKQHKPCVHTPYLIQTSSQLYWRVQTELAIETGKVTELVHKRGCKNLSVRLPVMRKKIAWENTKAPVVHFPPTCPYLPSPKKIFWFTHKYWWSVWTTFHLFAKIYTVLDFAKHLHKIGQIFD